MAQRCRLNVRAQMHGAVRDPGYEFILPTGKLGPHKASRIGFERINNAMGEHAHVDVDRGVDEPLYEVLEEIPDEPEEPKPLPPEPRLEEKIAAKRRELFDASNAIRNELEALEAQQRAERVAADEAYLKTSPASPGVQAVPPMMPPLQAAEKEAATQPMPAPPSSRAPLPLMSSPTTPPKERGGSDRMDGSF
jgi:hypothetical protein